MVLLLLCATAPNNEFLRSRSVNIRCNPASFTESDLGVVVDNDVEVEKAVGGGCAPRLALFSLLIVAAPAFVARNGTPQAQAQDQGASAAALVPSRALHLWQSLPAPRYVQPSSQGPKGATDLNLPAAIAARFGIGTDFFLNLFLTICGYIPGMYIVSVGDDTHH
jgi:hypothetical protein